MRAALRTPMPGVPLVPPPLEDPTPHGPTVERVIPMATHVFHVPMVEFSTQPVFPTAGVLPQPIRTLMSTPHGSHALHWILLQT